MPRTMRRSYAKNSAIRERSAQHAGRHDSELGLAAELRDDQRCLQSHRFIAIT